MSEKSVMVICWLQRVVQRVREESESKILEDSDKECYKAIIGLNILVRID